MNTPRRGLKVSTKLNLVFLLSLLVITGVQTWLRSNTNQQIAFFVSILLTLAAFGILWVFTHRVVARSLNQIIRVVERWRAGELSAQVDLHTRDEFQQLGDAFNHLSTELNQSLKGLEKTVAERTIILQRRARQLQAAAEVGRAAVTIRDLEILLPEVTRLVGIRFDVYHVGIFLLDETGENAVLKASNSEGGNRLLLEQHKLKVGTQGIVGFVAGSGEPRISLDVGSDSIHFKNPHLPETRSEIALPLSVAGKILGVLDVQSTRANAFSNEDASILQIVADQIAIAIDNAHLLAESRHALEVSRRAYGQLSQEIWAKFLKSRPDLGYFTNKEGIAKERHSSGEYPELSIAIQTGQIIQAENNSLAVPIKLRDNVIGAFRCQKGTSQGDWTQEQIELLQSITDQVSIALEAARLYEDTQRRAERERLTGEITARLRSSNDPNEIMQIAVKELRKALSVSHAQVLLTNNSENATMPVIPGNGSEPA
jgi:GAF domain-containing protein/HAMP domain-containing protein